MNIDWRGGVFANKVIMAVMSAHLTLREVGAIAAMVKWPAAWREAMTTALNMRVRITQRWPHGIYIMREEERDLIAVVQQKARQAMLPVRAFEFACWIGGYRGCHKVPITQLVSHEEMPYSSCQNCVMKTTPRHAISTHMPHNYVSARLFGLFKACYDLNVSQHAIATRFVRSYMEKHVDAVIFAPKRKLHLCVDLDAFVNRLIREHDIYVEFDDYLAKSFLLPWPDFKPSVE